MFKCITIPCYIWVSWEWNSLRWVLWITSSNGLLRKTENLWILILHFEKMHLGGRRFKQEEENGKNIIEQSFLKKSVVNVKVWLCGYSSDAECLETFLVRHKFTRQRISNVPKADLKSPYKIQKWTSPFEHWKTPKSSRSWFVGSG